MSILIYLLVFGVVYLFAQLVIKGLIPVIFDTYNRWQSKRVSRAVARLEDSFIFLERKKLVFLSVSPLVCMGAGFILIHNFIGLILGFLVGLSLPGMTVKIARERRLRRFQGQIVDSLMILSSSLKAGLSLVQALEVLCEEMPIPISQEFGLVLKENRLGISLEESLRKLRVRVLLEEVNLIVSSVLVARETGGELTRVFSRLTETIRNNIKLKEKIATLTLQGRLQGIIMSMLPIGFTLFIYKQNPGHFDIMWQSQMGRIFLAVAVVLQLFGMFLIKKISTYKA